MGLHPAAYYIGWIISHYIKIFMIVFFLFLGVLPAFMDVTYFEFYNHYYLGKSWTFSALFYFLRNYLHKFYFIFIVLI